MSCDNYPSKKDVEDFATNAKVINEFTTSDAALTPSAASDGKNKITLAEIWRLANEKSITTEFLYDHTWHLWEVGKTAAKGEVYLYDWGEHKTLLIASSDSIMTETPDFAFFAQLSSAVNVKDFGAAKGGLLNDALKTAIESGYRHIIIDDEYQTTHGGIDLVSDDVVLDFTGSKITHLSNTNLSFTNQTRRTVNAITLPSYREITIELADATDIEPLDPIGLWSPTVGESGWGYKRQFLTTVNSKNGNLLKTNRSSTFNFNADDIGEVVATVAKRRKITVKNLTIKNESTADGFGWVFSLACVQLLNCVQHNSRNAYAIRFNSCYDCVINNLVVYDGSYPVLLSGCSNVKGINLTGYNVHHLVATSDFTDGVYLDGVYGTGGLIEAHPAFDVNYNDVRMVSGADINTVANLRSIGGSITNAIIKHKHQAPTGLPYLQNADLTDIEPYEKDCSFVMENVSWYENDDGSSYALDLSIQSGYQVTLRNVRSGSNINVGAAGSGDEIKGGVSIENAKAGDGGIIYSRGETLINNSSHRLDATLEDGKNVILPARIGVNAKFYEVFGTINTSNEDVTDLITKTLRIHAAAQAAPLPPYQNVELELSVCINHSNAGGYQTYTKRFSALAKIIATSGVTLAPSPVFESASSGLANDTGSLSLSLSGHNLTTAGGPLDNYIDFDVDITSGGRTNAKLMSMTYKLKVVSA